MPSERPTPIRVLVVDDEEDFATALAERLQRRGFDAQAVFSGADALTRLRENPYDAVLLDLKMPQMDGLTALREIRRLDPNVQVVVLTGHATVASGIEGMQVGAADFLQKPSSIETLCAALSSAGEKAREGRERGPGPPRGGET